MAVTSQRRIRVLHVDDEPEITDLTKSFLQREDDQFTVETAISADDGLERINDRPPDCIVSDYNMPGMDGIELLQAVREEYPDLPFILFTGKGSEEVASDAISAGATDYLQKQPGTDQYKLLANRILNAVTQYRSGKRLRETQKEYSTVFENAQNAFLLIDIEDDGFRYQQCNPQAVELTGRDRTEIVGERPGTVLGPENGKKVVGAYRKCVQQRKSVAYTVTLDLPMGRVVRDCEVTPVSSNGNIEELVVEFRDITERKEREQELERQNALFAKSQDLANVGAWEYNPQEQESYFTDKVYEIYGVGPEYDAAPEKDIQEFYHPDDRDTVRTAVEEALQSGKEYDIEARITAADGTDKWIRTRATPQVEDGTVQCVRGTLQDITEHKEREQELQELKSQYETLAENFPDGAVFLIDADLECVRAGGEELSNVGLSSDDIEGTKPHAWFPEKIADELCHYYKEALAGNANTFEQEYEGERYRIQTVPIRTDSEKIDHVMAVSQNITERVEHEQAARQRQKQRELFFEESPLGAVQWDDEFRFERLNKRAEEILGYDEAELRGESWEMIVATDEQEKVGTVVDDLLSADDGTYALNRNVRKDGEIITCEWHNRAVTGADGTAQVIFSKFRDITERKERERELERTRDLMANMEELADTGGWEYNSETDTLIRTDGVRRIHGFNMGADLSLNEAFESFHPDDRDLLKDRFDECLETGEPYEMDVRLITPDGEQRWVTVRGERVEDHDGDVVRGYTRDITEQKEYERQLQAQNERLEEFASIVSHDLRNPLSVATGNLELAKETSESSHLTQVADALDRMEALIADLLTLAREGEKVNELKPVTLADIAESSWQTAENGPATFETHGTQTFRADRSRLRQLLENLYRNAVEHGGEDVTVSVGTMDDGFYVADTGPGIPESDREEVFEVGYSTNEDGTGFGLRIVEQIADAHGWEAAVTESEQGGARFEFTGVKFADR